MGLLSRAFTAQDSAPQQHGGGFFGGLFGFGSGTLANGKSALTLSAFYNGVDSISNDVAMLPMGVYKKEGENRLPFPEHPAHLLISLQPNAMMVAYDFWKLLVLRMIIKGNGYAIIVRNASTGRMQELLPVENSDVQVYKDKNKLTYYIKGVGFDSNDILHLKGFSLDGICGIGIITFAAHQMGVDLSAQAYAGDVYENRGLSYGIVTSDKSPLKGEQRLAVIDGVRSAFNNMGRHKVGYLDDNMKYQQVSVTPAEAQFLESRKMGVIEMARWLNLPPHKLKDLSNANYSNIYQQSIEYVQYTMFRYLRPIAQECRVKFFSQKEIPYCYVYSNEKFLLRGDLDQKRLFYAAMIQQKIMNPNEIRALEELNAYDGGDQFLQAVNMMDTEQVNLAKQKAQAEIDKINNSKTV